MKRYLIIIVSFWVVTMSGCKKDKDLTDQVNKMDFVGDQYTINGSIDEWLFKEFAAPYNIRVKYKWDRSELALNKNITPIDEEKVIPLAEYILKYYLEPYEAEAGTFFIKKYPAKQYIFVGSADYQSNGTVTLGSADEGRKVILYRLNEIDVNKWSEVERMLKTVHHEFAHILDQNKRITTEYGVINKADYIEDLWPNRTDQEVLDLGFITRYAGSKPSEDFAEMVAVLLLYGQDFFESQLALASNTGRAKLRQKEEMVVEYFSSQWGINLRSLQKRIADLKPVVPPPPLPNFLDSFGEGKAYSFIQFDTSAESDNFADLWNAIKEEMVAESNRHIAYMRFYLSATGQVTIRVYRYPAGGGESGSPTYSSVVLNSNTDANGVISFAYENSGSSSSLKANLDKLLDFFLNNNFVWSWKDHGVTHGGLYVVDSMGHKTDVSIIGTPKN